MNERELPNLSMATDNVPSLPDSRDCRRSARHRATTWPCVRHSVARLGDGRQDVRERRVDLLGGSRERPEGDLLKCLSVFVSGWLEKFPVRATRAKRRRVEKLSDI